MVSQLAVSQRALHTTIRLRAADAFVSATSENHLQVSDMVAPSRRVCCRCSPFAVGGHPRWRHGRGRIDRSARGRFGASVSSAIRQPACATSRCRYRHPKRQDDWPMRFRCWRTRCGAGG